MLPVIAWQGWETLEEARDESRPPTSGLVSSLAALALLLAGVALVVVGADLFFRGRSPDLTSIRHAARTGQSVGD
jgi:hypothetical protein